MAKTLALPPPMMPIFQQKFPYLSQAGIDLLSAMLTYDPGRRITAEDALKHPYFEWVLRIWISGYLTDWLQGVSAAETSRLVRVLPEPGCWRKVCLGESYGVL